ncbi:Mch2p [Stagonosporopsis vannaccii]|nr:Mch2p [Stagonosporopsis vannaccii]
MAPTTNHLSEKNTPSAEVSTLPEVTFPHERVNHNDEEGLPPRDRSRAAWTCLTAISAIPMATWSFGATQDVFCEYYFNQPPFRGNQLVASIGLLVVGVLQVLSSLMPLIGNYPHYRPHMMWTGMVLVVASFLGAAFSSTALQVIMTQGMMYGLSSGLLFAPCISFVDEWFSQRLGLANGIFFGSANIASAASSPIFARLLNQYGPSTTLIGWTLFIAIKITLGILCIRSRLPRDTHIDFEVHEQKLTLKPFKSPYFLLYVSAMAVQRLANNLPANYLPSYATDLGVDTTKAALLVTYLSMSGIIGQVSLGAPTDTIGPLVPMLLSTLVSSFTIIVGWGLGKVYWTMVIVSILFGAFAFSFMVLRSHMAAIVVNDSSCPAEELLVSVVLLFTRAVVGVVSGYIAAAVLQSSEARKVDFSYGAGKWRALIFLLGTTMTAATVGAIGLRRKKSST